jgi:hypothetical protein
MKKLILLLIIILIPAFAYSKFNAGIAVGYNTTQLNSNWDEINSNLKSGFQFGIFFRIGDQIFLQPELLYASRGGFAEFTSEFWKSTGLQGSNSDMHIGMFQIPVLLGVKLIDGDALGLNVQAGPVLSIIADKGMAGVDEVFKSKNLEDFAWGIQAGVSVDILSFILSARYEYALSEIYNGSYGNQSFNAKANTFLVTLGWKLL